jgi:chondroitin AC lyase
LRHGTEYTDLMPVWDWSKLPGQTNFDGAESIVRKPFAGGVTDGHNGAAAMDLASANNTQQFSAFKFWACYNNIVVTLVADAKLTDSNSQISTTLNQSRWQGNVTVNQANNVIKQGRQRLKNVRWLHHDGFAYIPLEPVAIDLLLDTVSGKWLSVNNSGSNDRITERLFMPVINQQSHSSLGYVTAFAATPQQAQHIALNPSWKVVSNTNISQGVLFDNKVLLIVFRTKGELIYSSDNRVSVNMPCIMMVTNGMIYAVDPLHKGGALTLMLNKIEYNLLLPGDGTTTSKKL